MQCLCRQGQTHARYSASNNTSYRNSNCAKRQFRGDPLILYYAYVNIYYYFSSTKSWTPCSSGSSKLWFPTHNGVPHTWSWCSMQLLVAFYWFIAYLCHNRVDREGLHQYHSLGKRDGRAKTNFTRQGYCDYGQTLRVHEVCPRDYGHVNYETDAPKCYGRLSGGTYRMGWYILNNVYRDQSLIIIRQPSHWTDSRAEKSNISIMMMRYTMHIYIYIYIKIYQPDDYSNMVIVFLRIWKAGLSAAIDVREKPYFDEADYSEY